MELGAARQPRSRLGLQVRDFLLATVPAQAPTNTEDAALRGNYLHQHALNIAAPTICTLTWPLEGAGGEARERKRSNA